MARDGTKALTQDLAHREADHRRWAEGGRSPDTQPDTPTTAPPVTLPIRLTYSTARRFPRAVLFASTGTPTPAR